MDLAEEAVFVLLCFSMGDALEYAGIAEQRAKLANRAAAPAILKERYFVVLSMFLQPAYQAKYHAMGYWSRTLMSR